MVRIVTRNSFAEAPRRHFACHAIVHYSVVVGLPLGRTKVALPRSILRARIAFFQREDLQSLNQTCLQRFILWSAYVVRFRYVDISNVSYANCLPKSLITLIPCQVQLDPLCTERSHPVLSQCTLHAPILFPSVPTQSRPLKLVCLHQQNSWQCRSDINSKLKANFGSLNSSSCMSLPVLSLIKVYLGMSSDGRIVRITSLICPLTSHWGVLFSSSLSPIMYHPSRTGLSDRRLCSPPTTAIIRLLALPYSADLRILPLSNPAGLGCVFILSSSLPMYACLPPSELIYRCLSAKTHLSQYDAHFNPGDLIPTRPNQQRCRGRNQDDHLHYKVPASSRSSGAGPYMQ